MGTTRTKTKKKKNTHLEPNFTWIQTHLHSDRKVFRGSCVVLGMRDEFSRFFCFINLVLFKKVVNFEEKRRNFFKTQRMKKWSWVVIKLKLSGASSHNRLDIFLSHAYDGDEEMILEKKMKEIVKENFTYVLKLMTASTVEPFGIFFGLPDEPWDPWEPKQTRTSWKEATPLTIYKRRYTNPFLMVLQRRVTNCLTFHPSLDRRVSGC